MFRKILALLFALPFLAALSAEAAEPKKSNYESKPYMVSATSIPQVLLVVSKEMKMYGQAYTGLTDFDGDGRVDTGFNPGVVYVGYFDSYSCYAYSGNDQVTISGGAGGNSTRGGDKNGYYYRAGDSVADDATIGRPSGMKSYIVSPRSVTGVCGKKMTANGGATFSGNWLNYITSSRMDVIRKILYGGTRSVDTVSDTRLEVSFIPPDATVWGTEVVADNIWQATTPLSAYFDITKYTPFEKPASGTSHFFARTRDMGTSAYFPVIRMVPNASRTSFDVGQKDSVGEPIYGSSG